MIGKVLLFDDTKHTAETYATSLRSVEAFSKKFEVVPIGPDAFKEEMKELRARRLAFRESEGHEKKDIELDCTDILIIDYDLLQAEDFMTGEIVARLTRCFSNCIFIIGLNQFGNKKFDLTLKGHVHSFCDLNIGSSNLHNRGLWCEDWEDYRPWSWPLIPQLLNSFKERVADVKRALKKSTPICEVLGIKDVFMTLPRFLTGFLGNDPEKATFKEFVMKSGNGLESKDVNRKKPQEDYELISRIAAARIHMWLDQMLLPGQNILVDAPHLVYRLPSLLNKSGADAEDWNQTVMLESYKHLGLDHTKIEQFRFKQSHWLSRPAWFWNQISNNLEIEEVIRPWRREVPRFVFCEDASSFHEPEKCQKFSAGLDSPFVTRYVRWSENGKADYQPGSRLE